MEDKPVNKLEQYKIPIALSLVGLVLILGGVFASNIAKPTLKSATNSQDFPKESLVQSQVITIDIEGAINTPGVYKLDSQSRIEDVIKLAGGFTDSVNKEYIAKSLNLAQKVVDGTKIYVPFAGEVSNTASQPAVAGQSAQSAQATVNINTASESELEALSGIGPATAGKIIAGRPYQSTDELVSKKVIGKALLEKLKGQLVVY